MWLVHDFPLINDDYAREFLRKHNITRVVADDSIIALWRMQTTKSCVGLGDNVPQPGVRLVHEIRDYEDDLRLIESTVATQFIPRDSAHNYAIIDLPELALDPAIADLPNVIFVFCGRQPPFASADNDGVDDSTLRCGRQCDQVWFDFTTRATKHQIVNVDIRSQKDVNNWKRLLANLQDAPRHVRLNLIGDNYTALEFKRFAAFYMQIKRWMNSVGKICEWTGSASDVRLALFNEQLDFRRNGCINSDAFLRKINARDVEQCVGLNAERSKKSRDIEEPYYGYVLEDVSRTNRFQDNLVCMNVYKNGAPIYVKSAV